MSEAAKMKTETRGSRGLPPQILFLLYFSPSFLPSCCCLDQSFPQGINKVNLNISQDDFVFGGLVYSSEPRGCPRSILNKYVRAPFEIIIHNVSPLLSSGGVNIARPCRNAFETRRK